MPRYKLRTLLIVLAVIGVALAVIREAASHIYPSVGFEVRAEFTELPTDDTALLRWLQTQPGVIERLAFVNREKSSIRVNWTMSRNLLGEPPIPDLHQQFERLGYKGLKQYYPRW